MDIDHSKVKLLIICQDVIDARMAGPGLRYVEISRSLSSQLQVILAAPHGGDPQITGVQFITYGDKNGVIKAASNEVDVILISGAMLRQFPFLATIKARIVVDLYDPMLLENLHYFSDESQAIQVERSMNDIDALELLAQTGDFFICGSERQRDLWMGVLAANKRINPLTVKEDINLRGLIDVVSIGIPADQPKGKPLLRGIHPQVPLDAKIVLWGGGIWNWLDPLTLIKAWPKVVKEFPMARLILLGTEHPNPAVPQHAMAQAARQLAEEIDEAGKSILFFEWLSIQDREALLCEADLGVVCHPDSLETHYALRTRVLDYFWAALPVVSTEGDVLSEVIKKEDIGWVVPAGDVNALAETLKLSLSIPKSDFKKRYRTVKKQFAWEKQIVPLKAFCLDGGYAADRLKRNPPEQLGMSTRLLRKIKWLMRRFKGGEHK